MRRGLVVGDKFDRLTVIAKADRLLWRGSLSEWICECDCGGLYIAYGTNLTLSRTRSCGCLKKEHLTRMQEDRPINPNWQHGHSSRGTGKTVLSPTYYSWMSMIQRCTNPKRDSYQWYGAKGVTVCDRWRKFANFLEDMGERPEGMTLDRIDSDGNYEPTNCRWATISEQNKNKRKGSS